jgi:anti-sigma factor RsiW
MTPHLGEHVAEYVDSRMDLRARALADAHLAGCASCRAEVAAQQALKSRLTALPGPPVPPALAERLRRLPTDLAPPGQPPRGLVRPADRRPPTIAAMSGPGRGGAALAHSHSPHRTRRVLLGAACLVLVGGGTSFAVGGGSSDHSPVVRPPVETFVVQHGGTSGSAPLRDPAITAVTATLARR